MKTARTALIAGLILAVAAPHAAAQQVLQMPATGHKPAFSFTKALVPAAPLPRLDLRPMFEVPPQDPDPLGLLPVAEEAEASGASKWVVGGLVFAAIGGGIVYDALEKETETGESYEEQANVGLGFLAVGGALLLVGTVISLDRGPQVWAGKTRGGVAGGIRIQFGR